MKPITTPEIVQIDHQIAELQAKRAHLVALEASKTARRITDEIKRRKHK